MNTPPAGERNTPPELGQTTAAGLSVASSVQVGPYRLLERIGAGGMGEVWLAEQRQPVRRRVALKVIKPGWTRGRSSPASRPSARRWR